MLLLLILFLLVLIAVTIYFVHDVLASLFWDRSHSGLYAVSFLFGVSFVIIEVLLILRCYPLLQDKLGGLIW